MKRERECTAVAGEVGQGERFVVSKESGGNDLTNKRQKGKRGGVTKGNAGLKRQEESLWECSMCPVGKSK